MTTHPRPWPSAQWRERFAVATLLWARILPDQPSRGIVAISDAGRYGWHSWDVAAGTLTPILTLPQALLETLAPDGRHEEAIFAVSPTGHALTYLRDSSGNDTGHYVVVPLDGSPPADLTPDLPPYLSFAAFFSPTGKRLGFTAIVPDTGFVTMLVDLLPDGQPGQRHTLFTSNAVTAGPWLAYGADIAVVASTERTTPPGSSLVALDTVTGERIGELWDGPAVGVGLPPVLSPVPGDARLLTSTDRGGFRRPVVWNPRTDQRVDILLDDRAADVAPICWSPDGRRILLSQLRDAHQELFVYEVASSRTRKVPHAGGSYSVLRWTPDDELVALWEDAVHPPRVVALHAQTGVRRSLLDIGAALPGRPWRSVRFASSDGQHVQAWLATPDGQGPFPTVVELHGGPRHVVTDMFRPDSQAWLDHGFAFMSVNYRGSTTFGAAFRDQIVGDIGHWELEDVVAARTWLVEQRIAHAQKIVLLGESYGGYLTLLALGTSPALWAGGMAVNAVADWIALHADTDPTGRLLAEAYFRGPPAAHAALYRERSPLSYAQHVQAPVLVIHGRNETHASPRQIEQYVAALRAAGATVELRWFAGGHGGGQRVEHMDDMLDFARRATAEARPG